MRTEPFGAVRGVEGFGSWESQRAGSLQLFLRVQVDYFNLSKVCKRNHIINERTLSSENSCKQL